MLAKLRNFSKSKFSGVLIAIIIVPFVFWGMGSVFTSGKSNNIAKINNENISTDNFFNFLNKLKINPNDLKNNIDDNTMNQILSEIISLKILDMEIDDLGVKISDKNLTNILKNDKKFHDEENKFSRIKYEKFLLENNFSATSYEQEIKTNNLQNELFNYVSGGIRSPRFLTKSYYLEETKIINIEYINLEKLYKKKFSLMELESHIEKNVSKFEKDYIDATFAKILPSNLIDTNEFNTDFFKKIDDIENDIFNDGNIEEVAKKYKIKLDKISNYYFKENDDDVLDEIYKNRNNKKLSLIDKEDYFLLFKIENLNKKLPGLDDEIFYKEVEENKIKKDKFEYNKKLLRKIEKNQFNNSDFKAIAVEDKNIFKLKIKSKDDNSFLNIDSLKMLYTVPENNFLLIVDNDKKVYLTKIVNFEYKNYNDNNKDIKKYSLKSNFNLKNNISLTYDKLLNKKYNVEINQNTLERVMNYFK